MCFLTGRVFSQALPYSSLTDSIYTERYMGSPSKEDNYYNYRVGGQQIRGADKAAST